MNSGAVYVQETQDGRESRPRKELVFIKCFLSLPLVLCGSCVYPVFPKKKPQEVFDTKKEQNIKQRLLILP